MWSDFFVTCLASHWGKYSSIMVTSTVGSVKSGKMSFHLRGKVQRWQQNSSRRKCAVFIPVFCISSDELSTFHGMSAGCFLYGAIPLFPLQICQWRSCKVRIWFLDPGLSFQPLGDAIPFNVTSLSCFILCLPSNQEKQVGCICICSSSPCNYPQYRRFKYCQALQYASVGRLNLSHTSGHIVLWGKG